MHLLRFMHMSLISILSYDSLKLDETVDVRSQIEGHFADTYQ